MTPRLLPYFSAKKIDSLWGYSDNRESITSREVKTSSFVISFHRSQSSFQMEQPALEAPYNEKDYAEAQAMGYERGDLHGYSRGYDVGFEEGFEIGKKKGLYEGIRKSALYFTSFFGIYSIFNRLLSGQK